MATQVQWRGGSTAEHATFTGAAREVTVDTQKQTLVVHDGSTVGGEALLREDQANLPGSVTNGIYTPSANQVAVATNGTGRLFVDASGRVGVGTSSPASSASNTVDIYGSASSAVNFHNATAGTGAADGGVVGQYGNDLVIFNYENGTIQFGTSNAEKARIDSSGRLLIGTSSSSAEAKFVVQGGSTGAGGAVNIQRNATTASAGSTIGFISFTNSSDNVGAQIVAGGDGTWSAGTSHPTNLAFYTTADGASSPTERLRITSAGLVGIGTASPSNLLHLSAAGTSYLQIQNTSAGNNFYVGNSAGTGIFELTGSNQFKFISNSSDRVVIDSSGRLLVGSSTDLSGGDADARLQVNGDAGAQVLLSRQDFGALTAGTLIGEVVFRSQASGVSETSALIKCEADATQGSGDKPGRLVFSTTADGAATPTERMRVRADGIILMNTTSTNPATTVGHQFTPSGQYFGSVADSTSATNTLHAYSTSAAAYRFYVGMDGTVNATNTTISAISDQRFKENIRDLDVGLNQILALQPRRFDWKPGKGKDIQNDQGFIAQEFEQIFPEMVGEWLDPAPEGEEPYKSVRADLIPVLVKAIQEQQAIINGLEARLAALEAS